MDGQEVLDTLRTYVAEKVLDGQPVAIEPDSPLLEWGVLNSISTTQLIGFIRDSMGVEVPAEEMVGENFKDLRSISRLVLRLDGRAADRGRSR